RVDHALDDAGQDLALAIGEEARPARAGGGGRCRAGRERAELREPGERGGAAGQSQEAAPGGAQAASAHATSSCAASQARSAAGSASRPAAPGAERRTSTALKVFQNSDGARARPSRRRSISSARHFAV